MNADYKLVRDGSNPYRRSRMVRRADGVTIGYVMYSSAGIGGWGCVTRAGFGADYSHRTRAEAASALWDKYGAGTLAPVEAL